MIYAVKAADFPATYPRVERFFRSFYERSEGLVEPGTLEAEILAGHRQCYVALRGEESVACALSTVGPAGAITWDFYAGDDGETSEEMMKMFEDWRAALGVRLVVICRPGWVRRMNMRGRGYRETHRVMELS